MQAIQRSGKVLVRSRRTADAYNYSTFLLSSHQEILRLKEAARHLMEQYEPMLDPEFFLASVGKGWEQRVVAVYDAQELVGIFYTKERVIAGIRTGIAYADGSLGGVLLATASHRRDVFRTALETLLVSRRIRSVRLRICYGQELDDFMQLDTLRHLEVEYTRIRHGDSQLWKYHAHLSLGRTYDEFLNGLGSTTRHNFRYYRRRFETSGHKFVQHFSMKDLRSGAFELMDKSKLKLPWRHEEIEQGLNMVAASARPLAIGLKHRNGEWLSVLGGWYRPTGAVLCFQCNNDINFGSDSLSTVLRGYLIEVLIRQQLQELVIWAGTGPPLSRYVSYFPTLSMRVDVPSYSWRVARLLLSTISPYLPRRLAAATRWIT